MRYLLRLLSVVLLLAGSSLWGGQIGNKQHVLLLSSYHNGMDWADGEVAGVRQVLDAAGAGVELHLEYMDTKRLADETHFENLRGLLAYKYRHARFKAVIASDNDAFNFLRRHRDELFGAIPVIFTGVNFFRDAMLAGVSGYTGVAENFEGTQTLHLMQQLHPGTRRVVVIMDATTTGKALYKELAPMLTPFTGKLDFEFWEDVSLAQMPARLAALKKGTLVLLMPYARDPAGMFITYGDMAKMVSAHSPVPVYGAWDFYMGYGIVGGRLTNADAQGRAAARLLLRVLAGEAADRIPVTRVAPSEFQFDARQLIRFGIPTSALPPGSKLLFQSWSQRNGHWIWLGAALLVIMALLGWAWVRSYRRSRLNALARRESEERYGLILQYSPTGILHYDRDLKITYCNGRFADILHVPRDHLVGMDMRNLDDERVLPALRAALEGKTGSYEGEYLSTISGVRIWGAMSCAPVFGEAGVEGGVAIVEDITERHAAAQALKASEAKYRELVVNAAVIILRMSIDGRVTYFNEFAERFFGFDASEILGRHVVGTIVPPRESGTDRDLSGMIAAILSDPGRYEENENENMTRDGRRVYVRWANRVIPDDSGRPAGLLCIGRDVTDRRRSEEALRESEATYRALFEASSDALSIIDPQSRRFVDCNAAAVRLHDTGTAEAFLGNTPDQLSPPFQPDGSSSAELARRYITQAMSQGRFSFEWLHRKSDGTPFQALISLCPIFVRGKPHILAIGRDISEQKRTEAVLREAKLAAESANRAKSAFLATMSHEIRTPMNGVLGMAQLLLEPQVSDEERLEWARTIYNSGQTLLRLLNDILDLSKVEAGRLELERLVFAPAQLLREVQDLFKSAAADKGLTLELQIDVEPDLRCWGDPTRLRQVLANLVNNAIKFTDEGGVTLGLSLPDPDKRAPRLHYSVSDSGIGIHPERRAQLFEAFSQVDSSITRRFGGSGLGLAITRSLVHLMGGQVGVQSTPAKGSRFWFEIPLDQVATEEERRAAPRAALAPGPAPAARNGTVLVAEDVVANQVVIRSLLKRLGYRALVVNNGLEAVAAVTRGERVDLVLMDCQMPELDGFAATRRIRDWERDGARRHLPIVALTAGAFKEDEQQCLAAGMDHFLTKPVELEQLTAALSRWAKVTPVEYVPS